MSTSVVVRPADDPAPVTECVDVTEATQFMLLASCAVTANIKFNDTTIATLNTAKRTHKVFAAGEYCITIAGSCCCAAEVVSDVVLTMGGGGGGGGGPELERNLIGCTYTDGDLDGHVFLTTEYDDDGDPVGDVIIRVNLSDGAITRPYVGAIEACSSLGCPCCIEVQERQVFDDGAENDDRIAITEYTCLDTDTGEILSTTYVDNRGAAPVDYTPAGVITAGNTKEHFNDSGVSPATYDAPYYSLSITSLNDTTTIDGVVWPNGHSDSFHGDPIVEDTVVDGPHLATIVR